MSSKEHKPLQPPLYRDRNLRIIFAVTLMSVLGVASITPAFPQIAAHFAIPKQSIGLLIITFTLPGIFLTLILGVLADRLGRKTVLVPALLLFGCAGGACTFVRDFEILLLFRFLQGTGAAALGSLNITLIGDLFSGRQRAEAMGYNASVLSIATASYPFLGGLLATFGWYYPFYLPLLAIPIGFLVLTRLELPVPKQTQTLLPYLRSALTSLSNKKAILYFTVSLVMFIILYGTFLTYLPIYLAERFGAHPFQIGLTFACMSLVTAVTSSQTGRLTRRFRKINLLRFSFIFYGLALTLMPFAPNLPLLLLPIALYGFGHGTNMPALQTLLTALAPIEYRAAFMSMNGMILRLGQTLGPIIMGGVFLVGGLKVTFYAGCFFALSMFVALLLWGENE